MYQKQVQNRAQIRRGRAGLKHRQGSDTDSTGVKVVYKTGLLYEKLCVLAELLPDNGVEKVWQVESSLKK